MHAAAEDLGIKMETKGEPPGLRTRGEVVVTVYEELPPFRRRPPERGCSRSRVPKPAPPRGGDRRAALLAYSQQLRKTNGEQDQMAQEKGNWRTQAIAAQRSAWASSIKSHSPPPHWQIPASSFGGCRRRLKTLLDRFPRVWRICGNLKCWRKNHHGDICQRRARIKTDTIKEPQ
ncbi:unnamed protein product [Spirodela intermedia]|uniref:Uncharacterized protein n=1 Tax=Spirodela intermedia TaxID=51605 RepID=A0A7I8KX25_SPIIN|nr:unnamed protein product [Spirodela intermedia]